MDTKPLPTGVPIRKIRAPGGFDVWLIGGNADRSLDVFHAFLRLSWPQVSGLLIAQVEPGSPADSAGLLLGDTVLRFADMLILDVDALRGQLRVHSPGTEVVVDILRGGEVSQATVTLGVE